MSWIGLTLLLATVIVFFALLAAYSRGYKVGFADGEEHGKVLGSLPNANEYGEDEHERFR